MKQLRIGEFSALCGVSKDTLRYYDRQKILSPHAKGENGYRYYTARDLMQLMQIRSLRGLDLALEECGQPQALPEMTDWLLTREEELNEQISHLTALRTRIHMLHEELTSCRDSCGVCVRAMTVPTHSVYFSGDLTPEKQALIAEWMQHMPYAHLAFRLNTLPAPGETGHSVMGIGILQSYAARHGLSSEGASSLPARDAVRCVLKMADPLCPTSEEFAPMTEYLRLNGLSAVGPWTYRLRYIDFDRTADRSVYYLGVCVEVK